MLNRLKILELAREQIYNNAEDAARGYVNLSRREKAIRARRIAAMHDDIAYLDDEIKKEYRKDESLREG